MSLFGLDHTERILLTILVVGIFGWLAIFKNWLTKSGVVGMLCIAITIVCFRSVDYLLYPFLFALIGSLISRLDRESDSEARNFQQVFANAGVAILALIITQGKCPDVIYITVFSIAMADTMSSEIGQWRKGKTINLLTLKEIQIGLSGGISLEGTIAGLLGAAIIAGASMLHLSLPMACFVLTFGFLGMLIDSLLGSLVQAKYNVQGRIYESGKKSDLIHGIHGINNDVVNFTSILITVVLLSLSVNV